MAFFFVETSLEGIACVHGRIPVDLCGVQVHLVLGAAGPAGEVDHMVSSTVHRL